MKKGLIYPKYAERVPQWSPTNPIERFVFFSQKIQIWKKNLIRLIYQIKQTARIVFQEKSIYSLLRKWAMLLLILNRRECDTNDELVNSYK